MFNNKKITGFLLKVFLVSVFIFVPAEMVTAAKFKIGIVNLERAGQGSERGKEIIKTMKAKLSQEQEKIRGKEEKLKRLREELNKQGLIMSEELKRRKETDYRRKYKALERHIRDAQEEMQFSQKDATTKILNELIAIIKEIGKKEGFTYITTNEFVLYKDKSVDITNRVIKQYNKKHRKEKKSRNKKKFK